MPEDSPVVDQKRHPVRRASCASTRLTRERMVCQRRHLLARCCGLLATGVRDAPGARKFNARSDRSNRRQPFICSWTNLNAPTPRILITRRWDDGLAPCAIFPAYASRQHGFLLPKRERGEKRNSIFPVHPLANTIQTCAKFRGTLDATIRTRPEDTR
jgi:hypothetical protein